MQQRSCRSRNVATPTRMSRRDFLTVVGRAHEHDGASNGGNLITHGVINLNAYPRYESECQAALFRATDYSDWFRTPRARRSCKTARKNSRARDLIQHFRKNN